MNSGLSCNTYSKNCAPRHHMKFCRNNYKAKCFGDPLHLKPFTQLSQLLAANSTGSINYSLKLF